MAAKLLETGRELPPGQDRDNALQEIARFRARIMGLQRQDLRSAQRKLKAKGKYQLMAETRSNRWTPREDDLFRRMADANIHPEVIAAKLNRPVHAIKACAYIIGLPLKWFKLKAKGK